MEREPPFDLFDFNLLSFYSSLENQIASFPYINEIVIQLVQTKPFSYWPN